jgi:uncharacterized protein with beta-barrel porin domain
METTISEAPTRGRKRKPDDQVTPSALTMRKHYERHKLGLIAEDMAKNALLSAVGKKIQEALPPNSNEQEKIATNVQVALQIISKHTPAMVESMCTKAVNGDSNAFAILAKWALPQVKDRINIGQIGNVEEGISKILKSMSTGELDVQTASQALSAFANASTVALHANQMQEIQYLRERTREVLANPQNHASGEPTQVLPYVDMIGKHNANG